MGKKEPKRRAWRKKTKTNDVEAALEDERLISKMKREVGATGTSKLDPLLSEVFTVDTKGSFEGISARSRREMARAKLFPAKGPNLGLSATEQEKIEQLHFKLAMRRQPAPKKEPEVFDAWAEQPVTASEASASSFAKIRRKPKPVPQSVPKTLNKKLSAAPAVVPAHEGQSVNPESAAYEELACLAAAQQLEREREEEDLERKFAPMTAELKDALGAEVVDAMDDEAKIRAYRALVCGSTPDESAEAEEGEAGQGGGPNKPVQNKKKSQAVRNRERKRKYMLVEEEQRRTQKKLDRSVGEIGTIMKEMRREEELRKLRKEYKAELKAKERELERQGNPLARGRKFGRTTFGGEALPVPQLQEGKQSLRAMSLKGASAIRDRIDSILRRGLLPAPPTASREQVEQRRVQNQKLKRKRKFASPLLRDNLLIH